MYNLGIINRDLDCYYNQSSHDEQINTNHPDVLFVYDSAGGTEMDGIPESLGGTAILCVCEYCGGNYVCDYQNDIKSCGVCGIVAHQPLMCERTYIGNRAHAHHSSRRWTSAPYKHEFYSNEKLNQANNTDVRRPQEVVDCVAEIGHILTNGNNRALTEKNIRSILRMLGCSKYGENWRQFYMRVNNLPEEQDCIPEHVIAWLKLMMEKYLICIRDLISHNQIPVKRVKNYNYVYRRLLLVHDILTGSNWHQLYGNKFKTLKSEVCKDGHKKSQYDRVWNTVWTAMQERWPWLQVQNQDCHSVYTDER